MDEIINQSLCTGNLHFFITINFEKSVKELDELGQKIEQLYSLINKEIQIISWYQICWEKNQNENYHLHLILAVRSFIGENSVITNNIQFMLRNSFELDTQVKLLKDFINIKKSWRYLYKDFKKEKNSFLFLTKNYLNVFENIIKITKHFLIKIDYEDLVGIENSKKKDDTKILIYFWTYYFVLNSLFIYKKKIFQKITNSMISYKEIFEIEWVYNNLYIVCEFYKEKFPTHFKNFNLFDFLSSSLINKEEKLKRFIDFCPNKINPNFNIMEFTDGIYFIQTNKFLRKDKFFKKSGENLEKWCLSEKLCTVKFYNCTLNHLNEPKEWLSGLENVLGYKEYQKKTPVEKMLGFFQQNNNAVDLLIYIAYIFHYGTNELKKKGTLYLYGESNTGKTTLVINPIINYFGEDNVALLSNNKNFEYQDFEDKKIIIMDELDIEKINIDNLKKLLSGELLLVEKKNKDAKKLKHLPVVISTNKDINKIPYFENKPLKNRLKEIQFTHPFIDRDQDIQINDKIKKEEAKIIVYCNRVYFNWIKQEKLKVKKQTLLK